VCPERGQNWLYEHEFAASLGSLEMVEEDETLPRATLELTVYEHPCRIGFQNVGPTEPEYLTPAKPESQS